MDSNNETNDDFYANFENKKNTNNIVSNNDIINQSTNTSLPSENEENTHLTKKMRNRKRFFSVFFIFLILLVVSSVIILVLAELKLIKLPWLDYPEVLTLSQNEVTLKKDSNFQFSAYVYPSQVHYGRIIYESSDPSVADINSITGYVETKKNGVATITAYLEDYHSVLDTCEVVVSNSNVTIESISVENSNINTIVGKKHLLKYEYYPKNAGLHYFVFNSSDTSIMNVNNKGEVTALKPGKAIINIIDEVSGKSTQQEFTVYHGSDNQEKEYVVSSIKLSATELNLSIGGEYQVIANVYPIEVEQVISWSSVDSNIATVSDDGLIKAVDYGKTQIIATAIDGTNKIIDIEVQEKEIPISSIKINNDISLNVGNSKGASITIEPKNATNQAIVWSIDDENIATVDKSGKVTAISAGNTKIRATASDGNLVSEANVKVVKPVNNINVNNLILSHSVVTLNDGSSINVTAEVVPSNATNKKITWSTSNSSVAIVSNGMIYGKAPGRATIIAKTSNNITKTIEVTVNPIITKSITLNESSAKLGIGGEIKLYANFNPSNASNKDITWSSSNSSVASVNSNGIVSARKLGKALITAKTINGKTATCTITVTNEKIQVTSISLNSSQYTVKTNEKIGITPIVNPSNATNQKITYKINNENIATIDSDGNIKGIKEGVVTVTATANNGKKTTAFVVVKNKKTSINYLNGQSIKYWYDNSYGSYAITHIWVKDAYSQFKVEMPDKFGTLANPNTLTLKAARKNAGKTLISVNASGYVNESFSPELYKTTSKWKNTSVSPIVIYEGNVLRDFTTMNLNSNSNKIYGMDKNGNLVYYNYDLNKDNNVDLLKKITDAGVKYTFGFKPVLVKSYEAVSGLQQTANIRQGLCQIDNHNFLYITNITSNRGKGFSHNSLAKKMQELGCKTGFNLDGGGSTSVYYVQKGTNKATKILAMEGTYGRSVADIVYFVGD